MNVDEQADPLGNGSYDVSSSLRASGSRKLVNTEQSPERNSIATDATMQSEACYDRKRLAVPYCHNTGSKPFIQANTGHMESTSIVQLRRNLYRESEERGADWTCVRARGVQHNPVCLRYEYMTCSVWQVALQEYDDEAILARPVVYCTL